MNSLRHSDSSVTKQSTFALWSPEMATPGGIQSYMWRLWEVLAATNRASGLRVTGLSLMDKPESLAGWANPIQDRPTGASGRKLKFMRRALGTAHKGECVIVGHINLAPAAWLAKRLGRIKRYVVVLHGIEAWKRTTPARRFALRDADVVVATTHYTAQTCAAVNGLPDSNFKVIPLCAEPIPAIPEPNFLLDGVFPILFVGRLAETEKYKGLETLMKAVACLNAANVPCKLHVIGDGDDRSRLEALAPEIGLADGEIRFYGRVNDAVLQAAYASSRVFVMPSAKEGFGIVFLEAMRHGVACIGGAHGGTPEVFRDGVEGILVPYGDVEVLTKHLESLANDTNTCDRLGQAGRKRFDDDYGFGKFADSWKKMLKAVVEK